MECDDCDTHSDASYRVGSMTRFGNSLIVMVGSMEMEASSDRMDDAGSARSDGCSRGL